MINLYAVPPPQGERSGREREASFDLRISTMYVPGGRAAFWAALLKPPRLEPTIKHVWLFDPSLAIHPATNPLLQMVELLRATEAAAVFASPEPSHAPPSGRALARLPAEQAAAPAAAAAARHPPCFASSTGVAALSPSLVMMREVAVALEATVLSTLDANASALRAAAAGRLPSSVIEPGLGRMLCGVGSKLRGPSKPSCVVAHLLPLQMMHRDGGVRKAHAGERPGARAPSCLPKSACAEALRGRFGAAVFNETARGRERCWVAAQAKGGVALDRRGLEAD